MRHEAEAREQGKGVAEYVAETEEDIEKLVTERGEGGQGIHKSLEDAELKGITPEVARLAVRRPLAAGRRGIAGQLDGRSQGSGPREGLNRKQIDGRCLQPRAPTCSGRRGRRPGARGR